MRELCRYIPLLTFRRIDFSSRGLSRFYFIHSSGAENGRPNTSWMHNRAEAQQCWGENKQWELMFPKKYSAAVEHYKVDAQGS